MKILILADKNNFFGQTRKPWVSIDTSLLVDELISYGIDTELSHFVDLANSEPIQNRTIFYHFSQKQNLREYICDVAEHLQKNGNRLVPSLELLRCHENKGYQELLKARRGINDLRCFYFSSAEDLERFDLPYPTVVKTPDGSNGDGVFLCKDKDEVYQVLSRFSKLSIFQRIDLFRRKYLRRKKVYADYPNYSNDEDYYLYKDYITPRQRFVAQEFVPMGEYDFRVTAIADRYFVMKRHNRKGDFRASGSKKFDFDFHPEDSLLNKASDVKSKFSDSPFLSMDFIFDKRDAKYKLIEFQALHFGVSSISKNNGFFTKNGNTWQKTMCRDSVEKQFAYGLSKFLKETD